MTISDRVKEAIQKDLPSLVGSELQQFIAEAEKTKILYESLNAEHQNKLKLLSVVEAELVQLRLLKFCKEELDEQERNMKVVLAEAKVEAANEKAKQAYDLVYAVFRNPITIETKNQSIPVATGTAGNTYVAQFPQHETVSKEQR